MEREEARCVFCGDWCGYPPQRCVHGSMLDFCGACWRGAGLFYLDKKVPCLACWAKSEGAQALVGLAR